MARFARALFKARGIIIRNKKVGKCYSMIACTNSSFSFPAPHMGKPVIQFLDKQAAGTVNEQTVLNVRITNPKSLDFIELKPLNQRAAELLERILERAGQVVRCKYCNTNHSTTNLVCSHCATPLQ